MLYIYKNSKENSVYTSWLQKSFVNLTAFSYKQLRTYYINIMLKGLFWTPRARIFPRSLLLGAGQVGFWEFGRGGSTG
jgi:hypothetical protein